MVQGEPSPSGAEARLKREVARFVLDTLLILQSDGIITPREIQAAEVRREALVVIQFNVRVSVIQSLESERLVSKKKRVRETEKVSVREASEVNNARGSGA